MYTQSLYGIEISVPHKLWCCVGIHNIKRIALGIEFMYLVWWLEKDSIKNMSVWKTNNNVQMLECKISSSVGNSSRYSPYKCTVISHIQILLKIWHLKWHVLLLTF